jgi:hypothetical protein
MKGYGDAFHAMHDLDMSLSKIYNGDMVIYGDAHLDLQLPKHQRKAICIDDSTHGPFRC